ncbi:MAG TPA: glutamine--fructose-6-phosphate aminotransferase, partial [Burkholderiales bacterium]
MCGIVAAVARRNVVPILLEGLKRLEYRGYDSAGVAVINGSLRRLRSCGRVAALERLAGEQHLEGNIGIGHTRWATHGAPSERNAHPHVSGGVSVVHNGIIENHDEVRARLRGQGYEFSSDTDTEVIAHLVHSKLRLGLFQAVHEAVKELKGAYAIAVIAAADPSRLVLARMGAPLLLGIGEGENFAASDTFALLQVTRNLIYLEDGDCAEVTLQAVRIVDARGHVVERPLQVSRLAAQAVELGSYRHYMQKEIFEQPAAIGATLESAANGHLLSPGFFGTDA